MVEEWYLCTSCLVHASWCLSCSECTPNDLHPQQTENQKNAFSKPGSQNKTERKRGRGRQPHFVLLVTQSKVCSNLQQSGENLNNVRPAWIIVPRPVFYPVILFLMKNNILESMTQNENTKRTKKVKRKVLILSRTLNKREPITIPRFKMRISNWGKMFKVQWWVVCPVYVKD